MSENSSRKSSFPSSSDLSDSVQKKRGSSEAQMENADNYSGESTKRPCCNKRNRKRRGGRRPAAKPSTTFRLPADIFEFTMQSVRTTYPGVKYGHENCLGRHVSTPKNMGWLWSNQDSSGGTTVNQNWVPGTVPKNVASVMQKARDGVKYPDDVLYPKWKGVARPRKKVGQDDSMVSEAEENQQEELGVEEELPILTVTKHEGEYLIQMNPMRDKNGEIPPIEPVRFRLQTKRDLGYPSSQSSLEFELYKPRSCAST